jgi:hypothetical protein
MVTAEEKGIQSITGDGLMDSIMFNYDALDWTVGFCRKVRDGMPRDDIEGWLLYSGYMQVIGLDVEGILQQLSRLTDRDAWAEQPPFDFWRTAILKVACRRPDGGLEFFRPRHRIPEALPRGRNTAPCESPGAGHGAGSDAGIRCPRMAYVQPSRSQFHDIGRTYRRSGAHPRPWRWQAEG